MDFRFNIYEGRYFFIPQKDDTTEDDQIFVAIVAWLTERFGPPGKKGRWRVAPGMYGQGEYLPPMVEMTSETDAFETRLRWC